MKINQLLILLLLFSFKSYSQLNSYVIDDVEKTISSNHIPLFNKTRLSIESKQYNEAIKPLDSLIKIYPNCIGLNYLAGISFSFNEESKKRSITLLKQITEYRNSLEHFSYWLGLAHENNDSLKEASSLFEEFLRIEKNKNNGDKILIEDASRRIENIKMATKMKHVMNLVEVKNIGSPVNTEAAEYVPLFPSDESFMIFTYRGKLSKGGKQDVTKQNILSTSKKEESLFFEDVFTSTKINDSSWSEPKPIKSINTNLHDAAVTLSSDGTLLFIYKNIGTGNGDLYLSKLNGNNWSVPVYQKGLNSGKWEGSAAFFPDNKHILFSSERKGGYGGKDLYLAEKIADDTWGNIINLGKTINSSYDEDAPFITADGKTLFFASNGKLSIGGYDILRSDLTPTGWGTPFNIGKPVNTANDDKFYIVTGDGKKGYYSSVMPGGKGEQDIYCIKPGIPGKPVSVVQISGNVTFNDKPVGATIQINSLKQKAIKTQIHYSNSRTGKFLVNLPTNNEYELIFSFKNLPPQKKYISTIGLDSTILLTVIADFYSATFVKQLENKRDSVTKLNRLANSSVSYEDFKSNYGNIIIDSLFYKIQIGAYKFIENFDYTNAANLGIIIRKVYDDGITRFTVGNYSNFNDAFATLKVIKEKSIKDAFIIVYYKKKYYYLKDILKRGIISNKALGK